MRVRDHIVLSAAGAALLRPWAGRDALGLVAGGVLIDADHYAWFCLRHRRLNPVAAVRFFNEAHPPQHPGTRALHSPAALLAVLAAGFGWPWLLPVAMGMGLHVALDAQHKARMHRARAAALERDGFCCQACGAPTMDAHVRRQPLLLPSYATQNLTSLCRGCHQDAHARGREPSPWT
ncbi:MAG: hypothetical protein ACRDOU_14465 [Streptosporangiaceae bacterium]